LLAETEYGYDDYEYDDGGNRVLKTNSSTGDYTGYTNDSGDQVYHKMTISWGGGGVNMRADTDLPVTKATKQPFKKPKSMYNLD
jgi:hypothetical protein